MTLGVAVTATASAQDTTPQRTTAHHSTSHPTPPCHTPALTTLNSRNSTPTLSSPTATVSLLMALLARWRAMPSSESSRARTACGLRRTPSTIAVTDADSEEEEEEDGAVDDDDDDEEEDEDEDGNSDSDPTVSCATASACPTRYCCTYRLSNVAPDCSRLCTDVSATRC